MCDGQAVEEARERTLVLEHPVDLRRTLGPLQRGRFDLTFRFDGDRAWRATRTPEGAVTARIHLDAPARSVHATAWGPGSSWFLETLPAQVGAEDDHTPLTAMLERVPRHPGDELLRTLRRRLPGMRLARTGVVAEHLVPTVVEQRVTSREARRSYGALVRRFGEPAPGPGARSLGLRLAPTPATLAALPYWAFHRYGIERNRAETIRRVAADADRLDAAAHAGPEQARTAMRRLRGVGIWSAAEVGLAALGDADAVSVGDFHLKNHVSWVLAGEARGDDDRMLELLEPYAGQRGRVTRLIMASGQTPPKYGPRQRIHDFRAS